MREQYNILRHYGRILADKSHETTDGHFIRFTTYEYQGCYYVATICDGVVMMIAEKDDIREVVIL